MDDLDLGQTLAGFRPGQTVFSRYTLTRILGRGGMGVVWLARDGKLEQDVALKFLPELVANDASALSDLKRETRRSLQLTHPHIVRIYDFVEDGRAAAVSMEFVDGASLSQRRMEQPGQVFSTAQLRPWVEQLCDALQYAHTKAKIAHRDLKPANLMIDARGDLKVADFGISATLADTTTRASKQISSSGTPVYMSPQQMMGEKPAPTDDVYSLGATLYELLTGKPPFHTGNVLLQVQSKVPPSMAERRVELEVAGAEPIPAEWEQTIAACLAKEAALRPQSVAEVWARLNGAELPVSATPVQFEAPTKPIPVPASHAAAPVPPRKNKLMAGLAVAGVLLAAGCAWMYFGVQVPQEQREAEQARREAVAQAETARTEAAARKIAEQARLAAEAAAKEAAAREQAALTAGREQTAVRERAAAEAERQRALDNARGGLIVRTEPMGADVAVGSVAAGKSPLTLKDVKTGKYPLRVRLAGYEDWDGEAEVKTNDFDEKTVQLVRSQGSVRLTSVPSGLAAEIRSEDAESGHQRTEGRKVTTPVTLDLPTGEYTVTFHRDGWVDQTQTVSVPRKVTVPVAVEFGDNARRIEIAAAAPVVKKDPVPEIGRSWTVPELGLELVPIAPGDFVMGTHVWTPKKIAALGLRDRSEMRVRLTRPYWLGKYEVTQGQWETIMGHNPSSFRNVGRMAPVDSVSYHDALAFCRRLTERERAAGRIPADYEYTLPTEAQWEYACRAGRSGSSPENLRRTGWYKKNSDKTTHPVGQQQPNEWGLYDMQGNVWEWCWDWIDDFPASSASDPSGPATAKNKGARGGSWDRTHDYCAPSFRGQFAPGTANGALGFRLALAPARGAAQ